MSVFVSFIFQGICLFHLLICCKICWYMLDLLVSYHRSLRHYLLFFNLFSFCFSISTVYIVLSSLTWVISILQLIQPSKFYISDIIFFYYTPTIWSFLIVSLLRFNFFLFHVNIFSFMSFCVIIVAVLNFPIPTCRSSWDCSLLMSVFC